MTTYRFYWEFRFNINSEKYFLIEVYRADLLYINGTSFERIDLIGAGDLHLN